MERVNPCPTCNGGGYVVRRERRRGWLSKLRPARKVIASCVSCGGRSGNATTFTVYGRIRPTAREFYYASIAPEEKGMSYQAVHHQRLLEDKPFVASMGSELGDSAVDSYKRTFEHKPQLSNDVAIESYLQEFISLSGYEIQDRLIGTFVAKRRDLLPNAGALRARDEYTGDLAIFHVGLSDACTQYSCLLSELQEAKLLRLTGAEEVQVERQIEFIFTQTMKLMVAQAYWRLLGDHVKLENDFVLQSSSRETQIRALTCATFTDRFILGHELAHHLLGHTGNVDVASELIAKLPHEAQMWRKAECEAHTRELQADALALMLIMGATRSRLEVKQDVGALGIDSTYGALLTLVVIGEIAGSQFKSSTTHPSSSVRSDQCRRIAGLFVRGSSLSFVLKDIDTLLSILSSTKSRTAPR